MYTYYTFNIILYRYDNNNIRVMHYYSPVAAAKNQKYCKYEMCGTRICRKLYRLSVVRLKRTIPIYTGFETKNFGRTDVICIGFHAKWQTQLFINYATCTCIMTWTIYLYNLHRNHDRARFNAAVGLPQRFRDDDSYTWSFRL